MEKDINILWQSASSALKGKIPEVSFMTWIEPLKLISWDKEGITLETPSQFHSGILESKYYSDIKSAIESIASKSFKIQFTHKTVAPIRYTESVTKPLTHSHINPKYTFDNFVTGKSNAFAYISACKVASASTDITNPLLVFGDAGIGKTHLLHAIGHKVLETAPEAKVLYITIDHFINDVLYFISENIRDGLIQKYCEADILLIDNLQYLNNKEYTQEEFIRIYNTLIQRGKKIVMACSTSPVYINILGERLTRILDVGLVARLEQPDCETRVLILKKHTIEQNMDIPDVVIEFIANKVNSNPRELKLILNNLWSYAQAFEEEEINISMAEEILRNWVK